MWFVTECVALVLLTFSAVMQVIGGFGAIGKGIREFPPHAIKASIAGMVMFYAVPTGILAVAGWKWELAHVAALSILLFGFTIFVIDFIDAVRKPQPMTPYIAKVRAFAGVLMIAGGLWLFVL